MESIRLRRNLWFDDLGVVLEFLSILVLKLDDVVCGVQLKSFSFLGKV